MSELDQGTQTFSGSDEIASVRTVQLFTPGTKLANRYEIREVIDWGGYSVVYLAYDRELQRDIALKVLRQDRLSESTLSRFRREVAIARDASSPRLVRIFDIATSDGAIYLTMELVNGSSLRKRIESSPLPINEVIAISIAVAEGLEALHGLGIVHRDVKPGNVLLDRAGDVKLGDFGLARHIDAETAHPTATGAIVGTLGYLSPEQALSTNIDHRTDLYSLGVVMFEMLTGQAPFAGESALGALLSRMKAPPPNVRLLRRDCPRWLATIVARLLEREPANRYPSASAVLDDLRHRRAMLMPKRVLRAGGAIAAAIVITGGALFAFRDWRERHAFHHLTATPDGVISGVSRSGDELWKRRGLDPAIAQRAAFLKRGHGAEPEIVTVLRGPDDVRSNVVHTLSFLDPATGDVRKRVLLPNGSESFRELPRRYYPGSIAAIDLDDDGNEEVIVTYCHYPEWPSYTVLYEPQLGRARVVFSATGHHHLAGTGDIDGDGRKDLLFRGIHNGYGWYNAAAAVKIQPPVGVLESPLISAATPDISEAATDPMLLWYAYLPSGHQSEGVKAILENNSVRIAYPDGRTVDLGLDGLPLAATNRAARATAHKTAFIRLRTAERLSAAGSFAAAVDEGTAAWNAARDSGDPLLVEAVQVRRGRLLARASRFEDAERHYEEILRESDRPSDVAMEAAEAFHLAGDLGRAFPLYRRALSYAQQNGPGRSRHELIEGFVLAAAELDKWDEGFAEAGRFQQAYRYARNDWPAYYREFLRWRFGKGTPNTEGIEIPASAIDVIQYWKLEFALMHGASPQELLRQIDPELEAQSPARSALLSLHAELLHRLGRNTEAQAVITRAVDLVKADRTETTIARAHETLIQQRRARIMGRP